MFKNSLRLFHTVRYLKFKQIFWRIINFFPRFLREVKSFPKIISAPPNFKFINRKNITKNYKNFSFLGQTYDINKIGWDNSKLSKLWLYNLNYFDFLLQKIESHDQVKLQQVLIDDWVNKNRFGKGTPWEPYPTSIRVINWIKWHYITGKLSDTAKLSLWNQVRWLSFRPEYHLMGNHLLINSKALLFAAAFFDQNENSKLYKKAIFIFKNELNEQLLDDGAHFELSPMYHSIVMEDFLDLINISKYLPSNFPKREIINKYKKGMLWLKSMVYENGEVSHFNDSSNKIAPTYGELKLFGEKISIKSINNFKEDSFYYHEKSGYFIFKNQYYHFILDLGSVGPDYIPGHAHADTLSFELAVNGERIIVNSGTSVYDNSLNRLYQRSTKAHSTIEIDDQNSSDVWSSFRVGRRAKIFDINIKLNNKLKKIKSIMASHNGYLRLKNKPIHTRKIIINKDFLKINDNVSGSENSVVSRFYIHPEVNIKKSKLGFMFSKNNKNLLLLKHNSLLKVQIVDSKYYDKFGSSKLNKCIQIRGITPFKSKIKLEKL